MSNKKWNWAQPLLFSVILIAGMWLGNRLTRSSGVGLFEKNRGSALQETLDLIRLQYVDTLPIDSIEQLSIEQLMGHLDPHSVYLPPAELQAANEELAGNFEGIGVEFSIKKDTPVITYVIPDGPSSKAGLEPGDRIIMADDSSLVQKEIQIDQIKRLIRGPNRSTVTLQLLRDNKLIKKTLTRGEIPLSVLDAAYMMDDTTGYIKLNRFSESSYEEMMKALEDLLQKGMLALVLDLRGNGGGFMNEAIDIADEFLDADKLIVYTQGAHQAKKEYRCRRPGLFEKGKLIVLVDESSASASEVLAGSLQDWCRATLIGRPTFGKGLVQEQFELSNQAAIRLTVARYYSPLGRSIQRSYENGNEAYHEAAANRLLHPDRTETDSVTRRTSQQKFLNSCGDTLYGGAGITPRILVETGLSEETPLLLGSSNAMSEFTLQFYVRNRKQMQSYASPASFQQNKEWQEQFFSEWKRFAPDAAMPPFIKAHLLGLIARYRWGSSGYYQLANTQDPFIQKAKEQLR
ncbi:MAG: S41 family peptidase [Sphingomonadales bacterium]|nr:S41 family peptidase [Sphingomonadales bacterium]